MDYNYIYLQQQIKALMNKAYVSSSSHSKVAEEVRNGSCNFLVDTVQKYFTFKYAGITDPVYIDPIGKKLLNVKFIGDVDVTKLLGGLEKGYGINIEGQGNGIYKISVVEDMFALKSDVTEVENKFNDYTKTVDLEANYATKTKVEEVENKFNDYTTTVDLNANYATKSELNDVDDKFANYTTTIDLASNYALKSELNTINGKFNDYTTTIDLEANYMKKGDIVSDDKFTKDDGYPYFTVKNEHVSVSIEDSNINAKYNVLKINVPAEIKSKILDSTFKKLIDVFKFIIRKQFIFKFDGTLTTEFTSYVNNGTIFNPIITSNLSDGTCNINYEPNTENEFYIAFDQRLAFNPYELYMNGELSVMYLLSQDALVSSLPTLRCDIIEAKNVLKLHESDVHYFYKPSIITDETIDYTHRVINPDTSLYETVTDQIECYKMVYKIPDDYEIPSQLNFKFIEHCFGNEWSLYWDGNKWNGANVQGRSNGKIESSKQYLRVDKKFNVYGASGCWIRCKRNEWNGQFLDNTSSNYMKALFSYGQTKLLMKDGSIENAASNYMMDIDRYPASVEPYNEDGYDYLPVQLRINNKDKDAVNGLLNRIDKICLDMTINGALNRLTFRWDELHIDENFGFYIDLIAELDSVEKINCYWSYSSMVSNETSTNGLNESKRDIELYLRKDYTDPIEEVNWDNETNAFTYIIQQQFYEITPNPNAATTLYTDYNITSSKIITADNITTMRSDLNLVTNTVDVVSYDVRDIKTNVETLNSEMAEQMAKTKYLSDKVDEVDMKANVGIALGAMGCVLGATGIGVAGKALAFSKNALGQVKQLSGTVSRISSDLYGDVGGGFINEYGEMILDDIKQGTGRILGDGSSLPRLFMTRSITTDLTPILEWCDKEYVEFDKIPSNDDTNDPDQLAMTLTCTLDICNRFRDSLKPTFKQIATRINEVSDEFVELQDKVHELQNIDVTDQLTALETKFTDKLKEYVSHYELVRDDEIDIFARVDQEHHVLLLEFEDNVVNGLIVFKAFAVNGSNERQRRFYIKIVDGTITDYKGVQQDTVVDGITIKALARSEDDRVAYMPTAELILDTSERFIQISIDSSYTVTGAVVEQCTCMRQMVYETKDIAYMQDIEALSKKIDALAEQSHSNDIQTFSMIDEFATVDEVNEVLTNNYVNRNQILKAELKSIPITISSGCYVTDLYHNDEYRSLLTENGVDIDGYYPPINPTTFIKGHFDFDGVINNQHTFSNDECVITIYLQTASSSTGVFCHNGKVMNLNSCSISSKVISDDGLTTVKYCDDKYALKSENEELKAKINALETQIASIKPKYPWQEFYTGFDERIEFVGNEFIGAYMFYTYKSTSPVKLTLEFSQMCEIDPTAEYLCILHAPTVTHFIRVDVKNNTAYINEIRGITARLTGSTNGVITAGYPLGNVNSDGTVGMYFDYVFKKTV